MTSDDSILEMSVREFIERAILLIVKHSTRRPDFERRIDLFYDVDLEDPRPGRKHRVRVRLRVTAASLIFIEDEEPQKPA